MEEGVLRKLEEQDKKIDAIYVSVEKTRKYILWTVISTVVLFVLPLIAMAVMIPWFMSTMQSTYGSLLQGL